MKRFTVIAVAALSSLLIASASSAHANTNCSSTYTTPQTITGNLDVPNNATCIFDAGASVTGNVTVGKGATLIVGGGTVAGNVLGNNCGAVGLVSVTVSGNVQVGNCTGTTDNPFGVLVAFSTIGGDFQCHNNTVDQYACVLFISLILGNVQVMNNASSSDFQSLIGGNTIIKNLECQNNLPAVTDVSLLNTVTGNPNKSSEGQCKGL
jgi:hypothetical protein